MSDPLTLLREFTIKNKPVGFENDTFTFGSISFPRTVETNFRSLRGEGAAYTLDAVWFMLQNADKTYKDYLADCTNLKFPRVSLIDKKYAPHNLTFAWPSSD